MTALQVYEKVSDPIAFSKSHAVALASLIGCNESQGQAAALTCLCEGLTPVEFVRRYHLIQGKPSMRADAMLAEFRMNYGGDYEIIERSPKKAAIKLVRGDATFEGSFTWEEASESRWPWKNWKDHSEGLKDNWSTPTDQRNMLWARLISDSFRAFCPELVAGVYTPEEINDTVEAKVSPLDSAPTATEYLQGQQGQQSLPGPGETEAMDAQFIPAEEPEPGRDSQLIEHIRDLFEVCFGDESHKAIESALQNRNVNALRNLSHEDLIDLRDKLEAKRQAGN